MTPAVNPWSSTLRPTVTTITSATESAAAVSPCVCRSSMAISPNRIEASPRGPIQPRNTTSRAPRPERTRASATGSSADEGQGEYGVEQDVPGDPAGDDGRDERPEDEPHRRGHQGADVVGQLQLLLGDFFSVQGARGDA